MDTHCRLEHSLNKFEVRSGEISMPLLPSTCRHVIHMLKQRGIGAMCNAFGWSVEVVPAPKRDLIIQSIEYRDDERFERHGDIH